MSCVLFEMNSTGIRPRDSTTIDRLSNMLDRATMAFLVMTAEELQGVVRRPRSNVIHEAGLFQGRLGFHRAIILLEDGCDAFSNVDGLNYIVFRQEISTLLSMN